MRHDEKTGAPGETFYKKTLPWPSNNYEWASDYISIPWQTLIALQWHELADDGVTRFDFRNASFLPPETTFWFSFYATVSQHINSIFRMNSMYWVTLNNNTGSTPAEQTLYGKKNHDFVFRDASNLLHYDFVNWTTAAIVQPVMRIVPTTNNLAWSLSFTCDVSTQPTMAPTQSPTTAPTSTTAPINIIIPPTYVINVTNFTQDPLHLAVAVALPIAITFLCLTCCCACFMWRRWKRKQRVINMTNMIGNNEPFPKYSNVPKNPLKQTPISATYTNGNEWLPVSLSSSERSNGLFNNNLSTDEDY
jgi:hypothetical protein